MDENGNYHLNAKHLIGSSINKVITDGAKIDVVYSGSCLLILEHLLPTESILSIIGSVIAEFQKLPKPRLIDQQLVPITGIATYYDELVKCKVTTDTNVKLSEIDFLHVLIGLAVLGYYNRFNPIECQKMYLLQKEFLRQLLN